MSQYTITTTDVEDAAIAHVAGDPNVDKQTYLEACVHGQLLQPWEDIYQTATATVHPDMITAAYLDADAATQKQVMDLLGVEAP